jgi:hypothetical protein
MTGALLSQIRTFAGVQERTRAALWAKGHNSIWCVADIAKPAQQYGHEAESAGETTARPETPAAGNGAALVFDARDCARKSARNVVAGNCQPLARSWRFTFLTWRRAALTALSLAIFCLSVDRASAESGGPRRAIFGQISVAEQVSSGTKNAEIIDVINKTKHVELHVPGVDAVNFGLSHGPRQRVEPQAFEKLIDFCSGGDWILGDFLKLGELSGWAITDCNGHVSDFGGGFAVVPYYKRQNYLLAGNKAPIESETVRCQVGPFALNERPRLKAQDGDRCSEAANAPWPTS